MRQVALRVPFVTLLKIALFALLVVITIRLWPVLIMVTVAALLAVMLAPLVERLSRHMPRGLAMTLVAITLFAIVGAFLFGVVPLMFSQVHQLAAELPKLGQTISRRVPQLQPYLATLTAQARRPPSGAEIQQWLTRGLIAGGYVVEGIVALVLVIVMSLYMLAEGKRAIAWLTGFVPQEHCGKVNRTLDEVGKIILAYMRGQLITCCLCGGMALTTLTLLRVPGAVPLAVLAFVADLVPIVGTIAMTAPAVLLALVVSPVAALVVFAVYMAYHLVESYWIIPRVYGDQMRLSTLTVLLAVTAGGALQGALGAVLILPFVAAYPVIERIWLRKQLGETVELHRRIESRAAR
jgi:predicted PurR-regulated permease PerM